MKVCVITTCTGEKAKTVDSPITLDEFRQGKEKVTGREKELADFLFSAEEMYTGQQHVRLMRGVEAIGRDKVDLHILSAGYGFLPADQMIAPYEATFQGMRKKELREWADQLEVPEDFREILKVPCDFTLVLLGDDYLQACAIDDELAFPSPTLLFCGKGAAKRISPRENLRIITLSNPDAKRFSCPLISLKGEIANRILSSVQKDENILRKLFDESKEDPAKCLLRRSDTKKKSKTSLTQLRENPDVDYVISIPKDWWEKPHRKKLRYFIPEWDDRVDPNYDFENDIHSGGRGDWTNEVYAHQMYPSPNYDGILMSRAVADKSKKKASFLREHGVHRFCRVPAEFPILGDCGAFDYIKEEVPPYTTEDVLDYYTSLGFNYGVSLDHLIVKDTEEKKLFRYDLTINNAAEFLDLHRKEKLPWEPIGAVQGWDPQSYAAAAKQYVKMGYKYIALGGLVRSTTKDIISILNRVHEVVPKEIPIHLFGIARTEALSEFSQKGVRSVDSASYLRRAWLVAKDNYFTLDGDNYSSIRIPEPGKSYRAKRIVSEGRATEKALRKLEGECRKVMGEIAKKEISVEKALDPLEEYDLLISNERVSLRESYRRTLEDRPWEKCPCEICQKWGIHVIVFRGNNRNRRRGFHNTFVYYRLLQKYLNGDVGSLGISSSNQLELKFG